MYGPEGVQFYTKLKTVTSRWPIEMSMGAEFVIAGNEVIFVSKIINHRREN